MEAVRFETTVGEGGTVVLPNIPAGEIVEVIVLRAGATRLPRRVGGWAKGKVEIAADFDDPIPGMEAYV